MFLFVIPTSIEDNVAETQQSPPTEGNKNKKVLSQPEEVNTVLGNEVVMDPAGNVGKNNHRVNKVIACGTQDYVPEKSYVSKVSYHCIKSCL